MESESNKLVSVIIVTSGSKDYLRRCLDSVKRQSYPGLEVIVIDNSRDPDFSAGIRESFPFIELYSSPQNLYYGSSLNKGIGSARGEFILCLNDDVFLEEDFIKAAIKGFLIKDSIGMVSGKLLRPDGSTLDSTGLFLTPWRTARERGYGRPDKGQFEKSGFIFGVSGAAAFYRKKMLEDIRQGRDYFDPDFRMFYEDLDISWRANNRSWQAYYLPGAKAFHVRGGSLRPDSGLGRPFARKYLSNQMYGDLIKNRYLTILKNESFLGLFIHLIPIISYDLCAWTYALFFRREVIKIFLSNAKFYYFLGRGGIIKKNGGNMKIIIVLFCLGLMGCATVSKDNGVSCRGARKTGFGVKSKTSGNAQYMAIDQKELDNIISIFSEAIKNRPGYAGSYYNRATAYFYKKDYDKSWQDIHKAEALGIKADQNFLKLIDKLKKASGREE